MREAARSALQQDDIAVSLQRPIHLKSNVLTKTETLEKRKIEMPKDTKNQKLTAISDVIAALTNAKKSLLKSSPHPAGNCTVAIDTKAVESLNLILVRTPSKEPDLVSTSVREQAAVETDIGKKAANIAQTAIKKHFDKKLSGEDYIKLLQKSPMLSVTKEVIKSAQRGDPPISGTAGNYSNQFSKTLPRSSGSRAIS